MQNNLNHALGQLLTIRSPFFSDADFIPEIEYLRALTYFNLCEYKEVENDSAGLRRTDASGAKRTEDLRERIRIQRAAENG